MRVESLFQIKHLRNEPVDVAGQLCRADANGYITTDDGGGFTLEAIAVLERVATVLPSPGHQVVSLPLAETQVEDEVAPVEPDEPVVTAKAEAAIESAEAARPVPRHAAKKAATKGGRR